MVTPPSDDGARALLGDPPIAQLLDHAVTAHRAGRLSDAAALYRRILAQEPQHADALHLLGVTLMQSGAAEAALGLVRRALATRPSLAGAHNTEGTILAALGRPEDALGRFERALALDPRSTEALVNLSGVLVSLNRLEAAVTACHRALALTPGYVKAHHNLAQALRGLGRHADAVTAYAAVLAQQPDHPSAGLGLVHSLSALGRQDDAFALLSDLARRRPTDAAVLGQLADRLAQSGRNAEALDVLGKADSPTIRLIRARCLRRLGRMSEAMAAYDDAIEADPDNADAHNDLGVLLCDHASQPAEACRHFDRALALRPAFDRCHNNRGLALEAMGRTAEAMAAYREALTLNADLASAHNNLGNLLHDQGEVAAALDHLRRAVTLAPDFAEAHTNLGAVLMTAGDAAAAEAAHRQALALVPHLPEALNNLGHTLMLTGRAATAVSILRQALAHRPDYADAEANLGLAEWMSGDDAAGAGTLDSVLTRVPGHAASHLNRGLLRLFSGQLIAGWADYAWRFAAKGGRRRPVDAPSWRGEALRGKRILVYREQGIGDELMFASCVPDLALAGAVVLLETEPRLVPLFERSMPPIEVRPAIEAGEANRGSNAVDWHVFIGSLPAAYRPSLASFPVSPWPLVADPARVLFWRNRLEGLGPGLRVGICWRSSLRSLDRVGVYTRLEDWRPLLTQAGMHAVLLQYDDCAQEVAAFEQATGVRLHRWPDLDLRDDLDGVAALMTSLDLVITAPTSVGELAAALGTPVWRLGGQKDWTRLNTAVRPWFPAMRVLARPTGSPDGFAHGLGRRLRRLRSDRPERPESTTATLPAPPPPTDQVAAQFAQLSLRHLRAEDLGAARRLLRRALPLHPTAAVLHAAQAELYRQHGDLAAAERSLATAQRLAPKTAAHAVNRAALLEALGRNGDAEIVLQAAVEQWPDLAQAWANLGNLLLRRGEAEAAEDRQRQALALKPEHPPFLTNLGSALAAQERFEAAAAANRAALAIDPAHAPSWTALGTALSALDQSSEAEACHARALELDPTSADALCNLGLLKQKCYAWAEAERLFSAALDANRGFFLAQFNRALLRLSRGQLADGWVDSPARFRVHGSGSVARGHPAPEWDGEPLCGRRLLVWREQGIGDEILFATFYPFVLQAGGEIVIEADRRLAPLFRRTFATACVQPVVPGVALPEPPPADLHCPAGKLPRLAYRTLAQPIPYRRRPALCVDASRVAEMARRMAPLARRLRVGVCWRSTLVTETRRRAYTSLSDWDAIFAVPDIAFVTLQPGAAEAELLAAEQRASTTLHRWPDVHLKDDLEAVAAVMVNLDLVISVPTAVSELAGAFDVPVWRLDAIGSWTMLGTACRPWVPSCRVYQPRPFRAMRSVLSTIARALRRLRPGSPRPGPPW